jgi:hypothetical protein
MARIMNIPPRRKVIIDHTMILFSAVLLQQFRYVLRRWLDPMFAIDKNIFDFERVNKT